MTLTLDPKSAMVMTHTHAKGLDQKSVDSEDRVETNGRTDGLTDRRTEAVALQGINSIGLGLPVLMTRDRCRSVCLRFHGRTDGQTDGRRRLHYLTRSVIA